MPQSEPALAPALSTCAMYPKPVFFAYPPGRHKQL
jgi:hypothetical protein